LLKAATALSQLPSAAVPKEIGLFKEYNLLLMRLATGDEK
jgi:hypothetical protein